MDIILNWILAIYSTYLATISLKKIFEKPEDLLNYTIIIIYIFNCIPIILDLFFGKPNYMLLPWYKNFEVSASYVEIDIIYAILVLVVLLALRFYSIFRKKQAEYNIFINKSKIFTGNVLLVISLLPILFFVLSALLSPEPLNMFTYTNSVSRGFNEFFMGLYTNFELLGIYTFTIWIFEKERSKKGNILLILYYLAIAWINGKRYIVVTEILIYFYYYLNANKLRNKKINLNLKWVGLAGTIVFFYFLYLINFKLIGDFSIENLYLNYRIDFGRDDVTKFVIYRELIQNNPILDYRGQSLLSTLLFFIPRFIWENKPYPHYRYLTAALYETNVLSIPAGMTPSLFETSIANVGIILGVFITPVILVFLIYRSNKTNSISRKALFLLLLAALLTQSLDSIIMVLILLPLGSVPIKIKLRG